jgi:hypothetical protein
LIVIEIKREIDRVNALNDLLVGEEMDLAEANRKIKKLEGIQSTILKHASELIDFELLTEFEDRVGAIE